MAPRNNVNRLTIGFAAIGDFRSIIGQEIVNGINKAALDFDINIINFTGGIYNSLTEDIEYKIHYKKILKYLNGYNIDGLISWASTFYTFMTNEEIYSYHKNLSNLPTVCIGMPVPEIPSIYIDDRMGIKNIMTHLIKEHGKNKIAFVGIDNKKHFSYIERFNAYQESLKEFNIPYNKELYLEINEIGNKQEIENITNLILDEKKLFKNKAIDAIVTVSDLVAYDLIDELHKRNISVPQDIAIVGFNNQLESIRSMPPLTTIDPHFYQLGYKAVESIITLINKNNIQMNIITPCDLVLRQSCGCLEENVSSIKYLKNDEESLNGNHLDLLSNENLDKLISQLTEIIRTFNEKFNHTFAKELLECLLYDLKKDSSFKFIHFIKQYFFDYENVTENNLLVWQNVISDIRNLFLPYFSSDYNKLLKLENIFHQTRVMIDVAYSYLSFSKRGDQYQIGTLIKISTDLRLVKDLNEIYDLIKLYFKDLGIPETYLFLFDNPKDEISSSKLAYTSRKKNEIDLSQKEIISSYRIPKKAIITDEKRKTIIFELLFFKEKYLGFLLMEMGPMNLPLYDTIRKILNPSIFLAMENIKDISKADDFELIKSKLGIKNNTEPVKELTVNKILEYLSNRINVMTNLDIIAKDLNVSKPSLMKKTKQLTGHSIQKLHEMLKIEKAKQLFENNNINISEISYHLGYKDQLYFSRVFKKNTGMSPKKWIEVSTKIKT